MRHRTSTSERRQTSPNPRTRPFSVALPFSLTSGRRPSEQQNPTLGAPHCHSDLLPARCADARSYVKSRTDVQSTDSMALPVKPEIPYRTTRRSPVADRSLQISWEAQNYMTALVMKRDDLGQTDQPDRCPFRLAWATTAKLQQEAEAALGRLERTFSANHTKSALGSPLRRIPPHCAPNDSDAPTPFSAALAHRIITPGQTLEPNAWKSECTGNFS